MNSLHIELQQIGKRFGRQWLFQNVSVLMQTGKTYALTGNNGSGKSTLLQLIYGYQTPSKGKLSVQLNQQDIPVSELFGHSAFVAPYIDLPEELTVEEQLKFHFSFKTIAPGFTISKIIEEIWLTESTGKKIKHLSSGMRQRLKLAQAFYSDVPLWFFDEPCTNLDAKGMEWYRNQVIGSGKKKLVIIASNQVYEYDFADQVIEVNS
ncbi:MAG: ATP-binding cassette domain-containing protein [Bacteroidota bacterium]